MDTTITNLASNTPIAITGIIMAGLVVIVFILAITTDFFNNFGK